MDLTYDVDSNTLRLTPGPVDDMALPSRTRLLDAILDIGEGGRLIGVEFPARAATMSHWRDDPATSSVVSLDGDGRAYIQITTGDTGTVRSTPLSLVAEYNPADELIALVIPRRGHGYEITYPSGNQ